MVEDVLYEELKAAMRSVELAEASIAEASLADGVTGEMFAIRQLKSGIIAKFAAWLSSNADVVPSKEVVLEMLSRAIDAALIATGRPLIAKLLGPIVKQQILTLAGSLYDSIFAPNPPVFEV